MDVIIIKYTKSFLDKSGLYIIDRKEYDRLYPIWKPIFINNKKTNYSISNVGEVRNDNSNVILRWEPTTKDGYIRTQLSLDNSNRVSPLIHNLVATAFLTNPDNSGEVIHKDGNKKNNWYKNLEYVSLTRENGEIWKKIYINNYFTNHLVSNFGKVKIYNTGKLKTIIKSRKGYALVSIKSKQYPIHRLVALAFIPNPDNKPQVNHINCIKDDNRVENLEWCTNQENIIHAYKNGLIHHKCGDENPTTKYTSKINKNIIKLCKKCIYSDMEISRILSKKYNMNISRAHICKIRLDNLGPGSASPRKHGEERPTAKYTEDQAHQVCKLLLENKQPKEISKLLNVSLEFPTSIKHGRSWKHVSSQYDFTKIKKFKKYPKEIKDQIFDLCIKGYSNKDIANIVNLKDPNGRGADYVGEYRRSRKNEIMNHNNSSCS